nr:hypothetical protein [Tanacetum cinerariifolium]
MIDWLSIVETDKVIHIVEADIVKLVVEIESFGMSTNKFDEDTGSSDVLQPNIGGRLSALERIALSARVVIENFENGLIIAALKDELRKLKGKALVDNVVTTHTIDQEMLKIDMEPIALKLLNNRTAHSDYLKHTQEQVAILTEVVEQGKSQNPLNNSLDSACDEVKEPLIPKLNKDKHSICCKNTTHMMNALTEARIESREMLLSIHHSVKMLLDIISKMNRKLKDENIKRNDKRKEKVNDVFQKL